MGATKTDAINDEIKKQLAVQRRETVAVAKLAAKMAADVKKSSAAVVTAAQQAAGAKADAVANSASANAEEQETALKKKAAGMTSTAQAAKVASKLKAIKAEEKSGEEAKASAAVKVADLKNKLALLEKRFATAKTKDLTTISNEVLEQYRSASRGIAEILASKESLKMTAVVAAKLKCSLQSVIDKTKAQEATISAITTAVKKIGLAKEAQKVATDALNIRKAVAKAEKA